MASLNTLRTRGGLIVSIVIGLALVAFLLGDFVPQSCSDLSVGKIKGKKISYEEFYNQSEIYTVVTQTLSGRDALTSEETDYARDLAWESLVVKYSYQPGFEKMGLWSSEAEQVDMVSGVYLSPVIAGTFRDPQTGVYNPDVLKNFVGAIDDDDTGRGQLVWNYMKNQMNTQRAMSKYMQLVSKGMYVNDLEVERALEASNNIYAANFVKIDYSTVGDSLIRVTDKDIKEYYNNHKNKYRQQASRSIEYVIFDLLPSADDYAEAQKFINMIADEFEVAENPMQYAQLNSQIAPSTRFLKDTQVDAAIAAAVFEKPDAIYGPELSGDIYTLARLGEVKMLPDTIRASQILIAPGQEELADSLVGVLRNGGNFGQLALLYSEDEASRLSGGEIGDLDPQEMWEGFSTPMVSNRIGEIFTVETNFGTHIMKVDYRSPVVRKAQIATIRYKVDPSNATQQLAYAEASKFMSAAAGSYDNFQKAASESALIPRHATIRNGDRNVSGLDDSRELVRWAFTNKKGAVSDIKDVNGDYVIAAVTGVREEGTAKVEDVADDITNILRQRGKADYIAANINGTTLEQVATDKGLEIKDTDNLTFGTFFQQNVGMEMRFIGAVASTQQTNRLSKPVKSGSGVFLFEVTDITSEDYATAESERVLLEANLESYFGERVAFALSEGAEIQDNRIRYF